MPRRGMVVVALVAVYAACDKSDASAPASGTVDGGVSPGEGGLADGGPRADGSSGPADSSASDAGAVFDARPRCTPGPTIHDDLTSLPQPPPASGGAGVSFVNDWSANAATGGWKRSQIIDACRFHAEGRTWHGKAAARVEVDPGDDPLALGAGSERAEMLVMQDATGNDIVETAGSGDVYYATSYFFPTSWDGTFLRGDDNSWSYVLQFYPSGALAAGRRGATDPQGFFLTFGGTEIAFATSATLALGKWTDLVMEVVWSTLKIVVWRRDEGDSGFVKVADGTGGGLSEDGVTMKQGLYRGGDVLGRVDILWIGPTARGTSFAAVEQAAFGTNAGRP